MYRSLRIASLGLAALALSLTGCKARSQLVLGIITNMRVSDDLSDVEMDISRNDVIFQHYTWSISDQDARDYVLPGSFTVYSDDGASPVTQIELRGRQGNNQRIKRNLSVQLQSEQDLFYRMSLVQKCTSGNPNASENCPEGFTCIEGICKPIVVDPKTLAHWSPDIDLVGEVSCDSGSGFIKTGSCSDGTCDPIPVKGTCKADEFCRDGTCYPMNMTAPQQLEFGELCRADQGETCRDTNYQCGETPNGSGAARCRLRCNMIGADPACNSPLNRLPDAIAANVPTNRARCITANGFPPVCTFACNPFAGSVGGCLSGQVCSLITDSMSFLAPDCVPSAGTPPALNQPCDPTKAGICGQGATCLVPPGSPTPMGFCRALCDPSGTVPCSGGAACQPLKVSMSAPSSTEYGVCCPNNNCNM